MRYRKIHSVSVDAFKIDVMSNTKGTNTRLNYLVSMLPRDIITHSVWTQKENLMIFPYSLTLFSDCARQVSMFPIGRRE